MNEPIIDERAQAALGRHLVASLMTAGLMTGLLIFALKIFYTPVSAFAGGCKSAEECKKGEECIEGVCERPFCAVGEPCTMNCDCPAPNTCAGEPGYERCTLPPPPLPTCTEPGTAELIGQLRTVHADCLKKTGGKDAGSCDPKDLALFYREHPDAERLFRESKSGVLVVFMFPNGKPDERDGQTPWAKETLPAYVEQVRDLGLVETLRGASAVVMLARATPSRDQNADAKYASARLWFVMAALRGVIDPLQDAGIAAKIMQFPVGSSKLIESKDLGDYARVRWVVAPKDERRLQRALAGSTDKDKKWLEEGLNRSVFFFALSCALPEAEASPELGE
jgi:hypothetical protein